MQKTIEQRYAIKFCVKLGKSATETLGMCQQAYGNDSLSRAQIFNWHKCFKEGRENVEDEDRSGRPSTSRTDQNVQKVRDVLNSDRRLSVRMIAEEVRLDKMTVHSIITKDLSMRKICAKLVPKLLTEDQKQSRLSGQERDFNASPAPLQSRRGPPRLLPFPKTEKRPERTPPCDLGHRQSRHDTSSKGHSGS